MRIAGVFELRAADCTTAVLFVCRVCSSRVRVPCEAGAGVPLPCKLVTDKTRRVPEIPGRQAKIRTRHKEKQ
jgi:hypothetical protein